jgi:hypothetical protein
LSVSVAPVGAVASGIAESPVIAISIPVPAASALAVATPMIVFVLGTPSGIIVGRIVIIDRIKASVGIVG